MSAGTDSLQLLGLADTRVGVAALHRIRLLWGRLTMASAVAAVALFCLQTGGGSKDASRIDAVIAQGMPSRGSRPFLVEGLFLLAGNCFALLKLVFRLSRQWNHRLDLQTFLNEPTLAFLARAIERGAQGEERAPASGPAEIPLTPSLLRLLEGIDIDHPRIRHHNIGFLLEVEGKATAAGRLRRRLK
jgi:hypothetical protein